MAPFGPAGIPWVFPGVRSRWPASARQCPSAYWSQRIDFDVVGLKRAGLLDEADTLQPVANLIHIVSCKRSDFRLLQDRRVEAFGEPAAGRERGDYGRRKTRITSIPRLGGLVHRWPISPGENGGSM